MSKNVCILVLDSLRKDRLSIYNDEVDFTPNFEEIAEESTIYTNAYAQAPWTLPSTASMFTGKYPWEHGATNQKTYLEEEENLLAERFKEEGYRTKLTTSNTWLSPSAGIDTGFDEVENFLGLTSKEPFKKISKAIIHLYNRLPNSTRRKIATVFNNMVVKRATICKSEQTTADVKKFLEDQDVDQEFFLFVNLMSPHEPYNRGDPPESYLEKHGVEDASKIPATEGEFYSPEYDREELKKAYDAAVDYTDDLVGEIYGKLEEEGLEQDTVLIILSDHGQAIGKDERFGHQFTVMEEVVKTPLIVKEPDDEEKEFEDDIIELRQLYDYAPYLAGITDKGIESRESAKGGYEFPELLVSEIPEEKKDALDRKLRFIKKAGKKIVKSSGRDGESTYKTLDLEAGEEIDTDTELKKEIDKIEDAEKSKDEIEDEKIKERLEDLGYM